jgi:integrase
MRRFYTHTRHNGIIYAELVDQSTGKKLSAKSTGTRNYDDAMLIIARWLEKGIPSDKDGETRPIEGVLEIESILKANLSQNDALRIVHALKERDLIDIAYSKSGKGTVSFIEFLENFWTYTQSSYVKDRQSHGESIGQGHCKKCLGRVRKYWKPAFGDKKLKEIKRDDLKAFSFALVYKEHTNLFIMCVMHTFEKISTTKTINDIMSVGLVALRWATNEGMIPCNPAQGLKLFSGETKKRGVLTPDEAAKLFALEWEHDSSYIANMIACTTGLRRGEVVALRKSDIGDKILHVRHSWSSIDGLKCPKNGEVRKVPLLPEVKSRLLSFLAMNPYKDLYGSYMSHITDPYIFYGKTPDKPGKLNCFLDDLKKACIDIGVDAETRNIVFHSHRHYYAARMVDKMSAEQVSRVTGHKSKDVFEEYTDHVIDENIETMAEVSAEVFKEIIQFKSENKEKEAA